MPTIEISLKSLEKLVGKKVNLDDLEIVKASVEEKIGDVLKIEIGDTNRPDLWSVEGIARVLRGYYGVSKGIPKMKIKSSGKKIIVDPQLAKIRPYVSGIIAKNIKITEDVLKDLISMQEKIAENYGRKRQKISVGLYNHDKIKFPVHYKTADDTVKFIPLESDVEMTLKEILEKHPKGTKYSYILKDHKFYPILCDSVENILSFPPIINSNFLGAVKPGINNLFVEITGNDIKSVLLTTNIFAYALADRGAIIESVETVYQQNTKYGKKVSSPFSFNHALKFRKNNIESILGIKLEDKKIINLLSMMQYDANIKGGELTVATPDYRNDIMHYNDIIEDIIIAYGYDKIEPLAPKEFTIGSLKKDTIFFNKTREVMIGLGFQEIMSPILSSLNNLDNKMLTHQKNIIEIENFMSENYSAVRSWVLPSLLSCLTKNMHVEYPQKIFEVGECAYKLDDQTKTSTSLAAVITNSTVGYQEIFSHVSALLRSLEIEYEIKDSDHQSFLPGRRSLIFHKGNQIGIMGEINPEVLNRWGLEKPVVAFEIDISRLV